MSDLPRNLMEPNEEGLSGSIVIPKFTPREVKRECRTCAWSAMEGKDRVCRFEPPKVAFIPIPTQQRIAGPNGQMMTVGGVEVRPVSGFPVVQHDQWCRLWDKRLSGD